MLEPRPFRFGVQASSAASRSAWVELARRVEAHGYSSLTLPDHFGDQLAPLPAMMAAADATTSLRVGALVFDNDYKHPVVLAKELATVDLLSDGRLEIGLGAGWLRTDYESAGMPYDPPAVRIERLMEGLAVLKGLFAEGAFTMDGRHYQVRNLDGRPKPVQRPGPPILIGGGGRRVLALAAQEADIVGINGTIRSGGVDSETLATMSASAVDDKVAWVRKVAGDRIDQIELTVRSFFVSVTNERSTTADGIAGMVGFSTDEVLATPFALIGTPGQLADDLRERRERWGFSYVVVGAEDVDSFAPVVAELAGT
jgi:probable F420-dependent oxidoreductase